MFALNGRHFACDIFKYISFKKKIFSFQGLKTQFSRLTQALWNCLGTAKFSNPRLPEYRYENGKVSIDFHLLWLDIQYHPRLKDHDNVTKWKHFPGYWLFVRGIHRSPVDSPHKGRWRGTLMFSLICVWTNGWANTRNAGDLRHHRTLWRHSKEILPFIRTQYLYVKLLWLYYGCTMGASHAGTPAKNVF